MIQYFKQLLGLEDFPDRDENPDMITCRICEEKKKKSLMVTFSYATRRGVCMNCAGKNPWDPVSDLD